MKITIIQSTPTTALVEWYDGSLHRAFIPVAALHGDEAERSDVEAGIPYGVQWEDVLPMQATPQAVADELRRVGIWTLADLERKPQLAVSALQRVYAVDLAALRKRAAEYERGGG